MNLKKDELKILMDSVFNETIKQRGLNYFENGKVKLCLKNNNIYYAKIEGNETYKVKIQFLFGEIIMSCTCPCDFHCKHEYAALLSIITHNYKKITLKRKIPRKIQSLKTTINKIPAEELKQYILKNPYFKKQDIETYFSKYLPDQSYDYYYNNLYNKLTLNDNYKELLYEFIDDIKIKIKSKKYSNSFIIIKAIINALKNTNKLDNNQLINICYWLKVLLKITYKKSDEKIKKAITSWLNHLKENNYYESICLENIIEDIKKD